MKKIAYLTNTRFPTDKAHGLQICKTCEAFAENNIKVLLFHPGRELSEIEKGKQDLLKYYGIKTGFKIRRLYNLDIFRIKNILPEKIFPFFYVAHAFLWGLFAAAATRPEQASLYYTRDITIAFWLVLLGLPTAFEGHTAPGRLQKRLLPFISKKPVFKALILTSSFLSPLFEKCGISSGKIIISHHGFSPELFKNLPDKEACRKKLGLPAEKKIMGYIGRFRSVDTDKGVADLIEMMPFLKTENNTGPLLLCVGGPLNAVPEYRKQAQKNSLPEEQILFIDHMPSPEVPFWIRSCDVVLLPLKPDFMKHIGTLPLKLFEYMAAEVPIVATDLPSLREFLEHDKNAILVEPGNLPAMAKAVNRILNRIEIGKQLSAQAAKDIQQYTWKFKAGKILESLDL